MIKPLLIAFAALACLVAVHAQPTPEQAKKSDEVMLKVRQLDLYNHILPVLMTPEQLRQLLPAVEKVRQRARDIQKQEAIEMAKLDSRLDEAIKAAQEQGRVPGRELLGEVQKLFRKLMLQRVLVAEENSATVLEMFKKVLNEGQLKAAANSLNLQMISPQLKVEEMTEDDKLHVYIREIFLDPLAYDVLVSLSRKKE